MNPGELLRVCFRALSANRVRTFLTALGLVIGNASVILVVTISLTSRDYILGQISAIGSNMVYAFYQAGDFSIAPPDADFIKIGDVQAVRQQLGPMTIATTGVMNSFARVYHNGRHEDLAIQGTDEYYAAARNLVLLAGRFLDSSDVGMNTKVAVIAEKLATRLYGGQRNAIGQQLKIEGLQFTVIGTFKEKTQSFGLSELTSETALIPISVVRYFRQVERIDPLYVQARSAQDVARVTTLVREILEARHRPGAKYVVENLGPILDTAKDVSLVLTIVLLLISAIALIISGIGIMNIMLVTVTERTREIGLRMAIGAPRRQILAQFLLEATIISVGGGLLGVILGVSIPLSIRFFVDGIDIPVSMTAVWVALGLSALVGLTCGTLPALRASRLNPTEALRYE